MVSLLRMVCTALAFMLGLSSCATESIYRDTVSTFLGHQERDLIAAWGPPASVYVDPSDNSRYLTYVSGGSGCISRVVSVTPTMSAALAPRPWSCTTTFRINRGIIESLSYQGNGLPE